MLLSSDMRDEVGVSRQMGTLISIAVFAVFAVIGILIMRKTITVDKLKAHHDVAGVVFANLGVL